jgi:hypothetical protein
LVQNDPDGTWYRHLNVPRIELIQSCTAFSCQHHSRYFFHLDVLVQGGVNRVLTLGGEDVKKFRADFRREAHQNSKYKAVPRKRLQHKEAAQFRRGSTELMAFVTAA